MNDVSFVIYFCSQRIENLKQTLRFLKKRENINKSDLVLLCQDKYEQNIFGNNVTNLNLDFYHKSKMCNIGIDLAKNQKIVLLDSDRILPLKYFEKTLKKLKPGEFVSTWKMYKLKKPYSDEEIELNKVEKLKDFKSKNNDPCCKNLFAGSTVFFKKDYQCAGGMDEEFVGYGFADTDMTQNILSKNYNVIWNEEEEIHLFHDMKINFSELDSEILTALNSIRYFTKWNMKMDKKTEGLVKYINEKSYKKSIKQKTFSIFGFDIFSKSANFPMKKLF